MKKGVILYHSNIHQIYKSRWITKSLESMLNQSDSDLYYYEINYGDDNKSILENYNDLRKNFFSLKMLNYAQAMNYIIDYAFHDNCDIVFNTNLDDYYHKDRVKIQTEFINDYDIISTDFCYISENEDNNDNIIKHMNMKYYQWSIKENLLLNHNVIAHPSVCYNKTFWNEFNKYDINKTPKEDLDLWKRSICNGYKFKIIPEILLYYRIHANQVSNFSRE